MALLPAGFRFSQASLATSERCLRRFYLRYLRRLNWPSSVRVAGAEKEEAAERGRFFHQLIHQQTLGLEVEPLVAASGDPELAIWWGNYLRQPPAGLPLGQVFSELELWAPLGPWWLAARFDRVVVGQEGRLCIVDWKTGQRPPSAYLSTWQTLVYCYVLSEGGALLKGGTPVEPGQISLCYWPAEFPDQVQWYRYSAVLHEQARVRLEEAAKALAGLETKEDFPKTQDQQLCSDCEFQSFCARGAARGNGWGFAEEEEEEEDWEQFLRLEL